MKERGTHELTRYHLCFLPLTPHLTAFFPHLSLTRIMFWCGACNSFSPVAIKAWSLNLHVWLSLLEKKWWKKRTFNIYVTIFSYVVQYPARTDPRSCKSNRPAGAPRWFQKKMQEAWPWMQYRTLAEVSQIVNKDWPYDFNWVIATLLLPMTQLWKSLS